MLAAHDHQSAPPPTHLPPLLPGHSLLLLLLPLLRIQVLILLRCAHWSRLPVSLPPPIPPPLPAVGCRIA